jgi:hypothetical protein
MNNLILGKKSYLKIKIDNRKEFIQILKDRLNYYQSSKIPKLKYDDDNLEISFFSGLYSQIQFSGGFEQKEEFLFFYGYFEVSLYTVMINFGILFLLIGLNIFYLMNFISDSDGVVFLALLSVYVPFFLYDVFKWRNMVKKLSGLFSSPEPVRADL